MLNILLETSPVALIEGHKKCYIRPIVSIQNLAYALSSISLGMTVIPSRNSKQWSCKKYFGVNNMHYGLCENSRISYIVS